MREITRRVASVLLMLAVVSAGSVALVNLDQGPEPVDQFGVAQEGDAVIATSTAIGLYLAGTATAGLACVNEFVICQGDTTAIQKAEKHETKVELATRGGTAVQHADVFMTGFQNNLKGMKMIARSEGMQAYWNAIQNGSSLAAAKAAGKEAVRNFYHIKATQVAASWNMLATSFLQYDEIEQNSSLPSQFVTARMKAYPDLGNLMQKPNATWTSPNGTTISLVKIEATDGSNYGGLNPTNPGTTTEFMVGATSSEFSTSISPSDQEYNWLLENITAQSQEVTQAIETVANQTYQKAMNGQINVSAMLSANTLAREYSRQGDDQAWAAIRLSQMRNVGLPENMNNIGTVSISSNGSTMTGVFLSKSNPASGSFKVNYTYNATTLPGEQMLVQESGNFATITGEFQIEKITTPDGGTKKSLTIQNPDYKATDISDWQNLMENMTELRAEINARQRKLMNDSDGGSSLFPQVGGLIPGLTGTQTVALLVLLLLAAGAAYVKDQSGTDLTMIDTRRRD